MAREPNRRLLFSEGKAGAMSEVRETMVGRIQSVPIPGSVLTLAGFICAISILAVGCSANQTASGGPDARAIAPAVAPGDPGYFTPDPAIAPPAEFELDKNVAKAIHDTLANDPALAGSSQNVSVKVRKGVVTLSGTVPTEEARNRVVARVSAVPGVDKLRDELKVGGG